MTSRRVALAAFALTTAMGVGGFLLLTWTPRDELPLGSRPEETLAYLAMQLVFATVAATVMWRRPENTIGWALMLVALTYGLQFATAGYGLFGFYGATPLPLPDVALWVYSWSGLATALFAGWVAFTFPHGRLVTRAARAGFGALALGVMLVIAGFMFRPGALPYLPRALNPFGQPALAQAIEALIVAGVALFLIAMGLAIAAIRDRYVAARGAEREQLKWFLSACVLLAVVMAPALPFVLELAGPPVLQYAARMSIAVTLAALPIAVGIVILRYRLYDIDVLINRTLVYGVVSAVLLGTYAAVVVLFQALLRPLTSGSDIAVAASTLLVVALFQPVRRRVQDVVDRRFYRSRYDAARTLDAFIARLRNDVELESVRADLLGAVGDTVRPAHATIWLRDRSA